LSERRLIVNADGFGFGDGATQGVLDALQGGFISSVSVNANFPQADRVRELMKAFPQVSIGAHLNPMVGEPCLPAGRVPSLVGDDGQFYGERFPGLLRNGRIDRGELEAELREQIGRVAALAGDRLTHLDSQGNRHLGYFGLFLKLARAFGLNRMRTNASSICLESARPHWSRLKVYLSRPHVWLVHRYRRFQMRKARSAGMRMADGLVTVGYAGTGNKANAENWDRILRNLPPGTHEIYCHPAYPDETLRRWSYYQDDRGRELEILRSTRLRREADRLGVDLISFDNI
jgi:chitin disaccharide deacetylase